MRRTRVRRARAAALAVTLAVTCGVLWGRAGAGAEPRAERRPAAATRPSAAYVVREGDTLWSIGVRLVGPTADPRPLVDELIELNDIVGSLIHPGQRLSLP